MSSIMAICAAMVDLLADALDVIWSQGRRADYPLECGEDITMLIAHHGDERCGDQC